MNQFEEAAIWKRLEKKSERELAEELIFLNNLKLRELKSIKKVLFCIFLLLIVSGIIFLMAITNTNSVH